MKEFSVRGAFCPLACLWSARFSLALINVQDASGDFGDLDKDRLAVGDIDALLSSTRCSWRDNSGSANVTVGFFMRCFAVKRWDLVRSVGVSDVVPVPVPVAVPLS